MFLELAEWPRPGPGRPPSRRASAAGSPGLFPAGGRLEPAPAAGAWLAGQAGRPELAGDSPAVLSLTQGCSLPSPPASSLPCQASPCSFLSSCRPPMAVGTLDPGLGTPLGHIPRDPLHREEDGVGPGVPAWGGDSGWNSPQGGIPRSPQEAGGRAGSLLENFSVSAQGQTSADSISGETIFQREDEAPVPSGGK